MMPMMMATVRRHRKAKTAGFSSKDLSKTYQKTYQKIRQQIRQQKRQQTNLKFG
jgi:hypothetical protein